MKSLVAAVLIFVSAGSIAAPEALGIAGVTLGMSLPEAKSAIEKVNPKYVFDPIVSKEGKTIGWNAYIPSPKFGGLAAKTNALDLFQVYADTKAGTVWYIWRREQFRGEGSEVRRDKMVQSLTDRYGPHSWPTSPGTPDFYWTFDRSGRLSPLNGQRSAHPCDASGSFPTHFRSTCGTLVTAHLEPFNQARLDLISGYSVTVANHAVRYDEADTSPEQRAQAAARKQQMNEAPKF